jgi:hypothetical protein
MGAGSSMDTKTLKWHVLVIQMLIAFPGAIHNSGRLHVNPRRANEKSAGPVEQSDSRLAFELRGRVWFSYWTLTVKPRGQLYAAGEV